MLRWKRLRLDGWPPALTVSEKINVVDEAVFYNIFDDWPISTLRTLCHLPSSFDQFWKITWWMKFGWYDCLIPFLIYDVEFMLFHSIYLHFIFSELNASILLSVQDIFRWRSFLLRQTYQFFHPIQVRSIHGEIIWRLHRLVWVILCRVPNNCFFHQACLILVTLIQSRIQVLLLKNLVPNRLQISNVVNGALPLFLQLLNYLTAVRCSPLNSLRYKVGSLWFDFIVCWLH